MSIQYSVRDATVDVSRILNGKSDELSPLLLSALASNTSDAIAISEIFQQALCEGYVNALRGLPTHPAIVAEITKQKQDYLKKVDATIAEKTAEIADNSRKSLAGKIAYLEKHGPRRQLQQLRQQLNEERERIQKEVNYLELNRDRVAEVRILKSYGNALAKRVLDSLTRIPQWHILDTVRRLKEVTHEAARARQFAPYQETEKTSNVGFVFLLHELSTVSKDPRYASIYESFHISKTHGDGLLACLDKQQPYKLFTPTLHCEQPVLTGKYAAEIVAALPSTSRLTRDAGQFTAEHAAGQTTVVIAKLEEECPALAKLLTVLTAKEQPVMAAYRACATVQHWIKSGLRLPGHRNAYIEQIRALDIENDKVCVKAYALEAIDGVVCATPSINKIFDANRDWLNAVCPGAAQRYEVAKSLGLQDKTLLDYVFVETPPTQEVSLAQLDL